MTCRFRPYLRPVPVPRKQHRHPGCDVNNLVHSRRFRMYKVRIWAIKKEIGGIAPALKRPCKAECCPELEDGGVP